MSSIVRLTYRFIPACAGNSVVPSARARSTSVHPRVCGELSSLGWLIRAITGSSPRVRGTHGQKAKAGQSVRFIPACAGNSRWPLCRWLVLHGSSPRVRGTRLDDAFQERQRRFIPACAGNSVALGVLGSAHHGSSPRVRGTPADVSNGACSRRFIPACAGNSTGRWWMRAWWPVHPRVCGELSKLGSWLRPAAGSSPRVRGTPDRLQFGPNRRQVHPRVCGELPSGGSGTPWP